MIDVLNETGEIADEKGLIQLGQFVLRQMRIHPQSNLTIILVDEAAMSRYHKTHMDIEGPTDVLSFPMDEMRVPTLAELPPRGTLGDVVLCGEYIAKTHVAVGNNGGPTAAGQSLKMPSVKAAMEYLLVHGMLHLLGYDHAEPAEQTEMFGLTDRLLADWAKEKYSL